MPSFKFNKPLVAVFCFEMCDIGVNQRKIRKSQELVGFVGSGGRFGSPDAAEQHQREIDLLKFKITRRDNLKIAIVSPIIGTTFGVGVTLVNQFIG